MPGGLVPLITNSGATSGLYAPAGAGGGGGGGSNPNPSFSSITLSTSANVNMFGGGFIQVLGNDVGLNIQNNSTAAINEIGMMTNAAASAVYPSLTGNATYVATTAPAGNLGLTMLAGDNEGGFLISAANNNANSTLTVISGGDLVLKTAGATSISTLNVSSINGAAPGGGASISVSSIAVAADGQINMNASASATAILNLEYNNATNNGSFIAFQMDEGVGGFMAMGYDNTTSTVAVSYVSETGGASGGLGMSFDIGNISSLTVSTINGAAPGGGSSLQFSTLSIPQGPGTSTFVCNPGTNPLISFSTTAGHVYSATVQARAQSFDPAGNGDVLFSEILDNNAGNDFIGSWPLQSISTVTAGGAYQFIGGSVTWKSGGTGASFSVVPSVSSFVRVDGINVTDFGAI